MSRNCDAASCMYQEHVYEGWYEGDYHNYADTPGGPIISEMGAQALPSLAEVHEMFGTSWPPDWKKLAYHDFQYEQTFKTVKLPMPTNWDYFVENSQRYQAELLKFAIEHYRKEKYRKLGSFFQFEFFDCWPSITWSVVSYERIPKLGYKAMAESYQPVLISTDLDRQTWNLGKPEPGIPVGLGIRAPIWIVNDKHAPVENASYEAHLHGQAADLGPCKSKKTVTVPSDSVLKAETLYCTVPESAAPGEYDLVLTLTSNGQVVSSNSYPIRITR